MFYFTHKLTGMPFDFQYAVQDAPTQNDFSHNAVSDGDVTRGEYRVALPVSLNQQKFLLNSLIICIFTIITLGWQNASC